MIARAIRYEKLLGVNPEGSTLVELRAGFKELTVAEMRAWLKDAGLVSGDVIDCTLFEEFSVVDLRHLSNLSADEIGMLPPSELRRAFAIAREVNADFFAMRARVAALGRQALSQP